MSASKKIFITGIFGLFLFLPIFIQAVTIPCTTINDPVYIFCKYPGGTCEGAQLLLAEQKPTASAYCTPFGAQFVACTNSAADNPGVCALQVSGCCTFAQGGNIVNCTDTQKQNCDITAGKNFRENESCSGITACANKTQAATPTGCCQRSNGCSDNITQKDCSSSYSGASWVQSEYCSQGCKAPAATTGGGLKDVETNFTPIKPLLQINIPTVNFSDIKVEGEKGSRYVDIPYLAEYVKGVFNYALGLLVMIAIIMLMIAGVKYIMARGGAGVGEAKKMIGNAVFGLILGLMSFVILNAVSPSLTNLSTLRTPYIERQTFDYTAMENTVPPGDVPGTSPVGAAPNGAGFNNVPIFKQGQSPWGTSPYGDCGGHAGHASYAYSACGATSLAMVLKFYGNNADPSIVGNFAVQNGYRTCGKGTNAGIMTTGVAKGWPNMVGERVDVKRAIELLKEGKPIVLATPNSTTCYSRGGHYIVATGIDDQGRVRINDPATCGRKSPGPYNGVDGIWTGGSNGEGFIAMTQQKFAQAVVGWYIHPK